MLISGFLGGLQAPALGQTSTVPLEDLLAEAFRHLELRRLGEAAPLIEDALAQARAGGDIRLQAEAHRGRGYLLLMKEMQFADARRELEQARTLFESAGDAVGLARTDRNLGQVAYHEGNHEEARRLYEQALRSADGSGDRRDKAKTLQVLAFIASTSADAAALDEQAWQTLQGLGDRRLEGVILQGWSDHLWSLGNYRDALEKIQAAVARLEETDDKWSLARALTSLTRLQTSHGQNERARELATRALRLQEEIGDKRGMAQSLNAIAVDFEAQRRHREALEHYQRALALGREAGYRVPLRLGAVGQSHLRLGETARALELLEEAMRLGSTNARHRGFLSMALFRVGRRAEALARATEGVDLARKADNSDALFQLLSYRAELREALGEVAPALDDARAALEILERIRANLAPDDFLKRGFGDRHQEVYGHNVRLLDALGRPDGALETAERARARAFLDLLATRAEGQGTSAQGEGLPSLASAPAPSLDEIKAETARLGSTLLSYWVGPDSTIAWVVTPDGRLRSHRVDVSEKRLARLVERATSGLAGPVPRGPDDAERRLPAPQLTQEEEDEADPGPPDAAPRLLLRGGDAVALDQGSVRACRMLYDLLVRPLRGDLPRAPAARLTIVPHGPLFKLSFAALQDAAGRYLLESYSLHYTPAVGVLRLTGRQAGPPGTGRALVVADPLLLPAVASREKLGALPGARREADDVAALLGRRNVSMVLGRAAAEPQVRELLDTDKAVIHFATHGVVRDQEGLEPFLALAGGGALEADDGRLTAAEIYGLKLRADLVFLSACRTAGGRVSGDGVVGLTRAFFAAGTPSVVATLWDVSDAVAREVVRRFYADWRRSGDTAAALRAAQLSVLRALRQGSLKVKTPMGDVALPEHPALWAPFVAQGQPSTTRIPRAAARRGAVPPL